MELSFSIPGLTLTKGTVIGFETGISDDDGNNGQIRTIDNI
jgi:hypothetical protein